MTPQSEWERVPPVVGEWRTVFSIPGLLTRFVEVERSDRVVVYVREYRQIEAFR